MSGVDNRIVTMQFNNSEFERNASHTLTTLQKVREAMSFSSIASGTTKALGGIQTMLGKIGLSKPFDTMISTANRGLSGIGTVLGRLGIHNPFASSTKGAQDLGRAAADAGGPNGMGVLTGGVTSVSNKFIALSTIAITALSNITNRAINAGAQFAKSFTVAPILDGLHEYETTLQSIQTVQANTDAPLKEVEDSLKRLNDYSDQTIYNFGQMARNVGTFTAAGVDLETSVASIQGIANIAALSGSSSEQAATAMYQLSQAISAGKVGLMDWNSVVNAGMGGKKLQNALAQTAIAMGDVNENAVKMVGPMQKLEIRGKSFRESIMAQPGQESWLSSEILVNTLASLDGRFSVAYQKSLLTEKGVRRFTDAQIESNMAEARATLEKKNGVKYSEAQYKALLKMADASTDAATKVKTLGQVFDIAKETMGSGWAATFKNIFGGLDEAKTLFTGMSTGLNDIIKENSLARNKILSKWSEKGGRTNVIDGLRNSWEAVWKVLQSIGKGFRDIFPRKTADDLLSMSRAFERFSLTLMPSKESMHDIRNIAGGVAAAFHIVWQVLGGVVDGFKALFGAVGGGEGKFLDFAGGIGKMVKDFDAWLEKSGIITDFFTSLGKALAVPLALLKGVGTVIKSIFSGFDKSAADDLKDTIGDVGDKMSGLEVVGERIRSFFQKVGGFFSNFGEHIADALMGVGDLVATAFSSENFSKTLGVVQTGLLGGILLLIKNFFSKGVNIDLTGGLFDGIKQTLGEATTALSNLQTSLKASILMKLAVAIGILALSLLVLSGIDPKALAKALGAMTGGFAILIGAMMALMKFLGPAGLVQMYVVTSAMTKMALSILILSFALKTLAGIKFSDMLRGLVGLAGMMFIMTKAMLPLSAGSKGMTRAAYSIILIGIAMNLLAVALKIFATMSWEEMGKGLAGVTGALLGIGVAMRLMPKGILLQAGAILILSVAMNALAVALKIFATMSWTEMVKGLAMVAGSIAAIGIAMRTMPKTMIVSAAGLFIVANALVILAGALKIMATMGWEDIAKGMVVLAGSMTILAIGLQAIGIVGAIGAIGMLIMAKALLFFLPVMLAFSMLSWEAILKSLTMLAGVFTVLGLAAYILAPLTPVILGLGLALLLMGAGLALAGAGALAAATAFGIVVAAGSAGAQVLRDMLASIIESIPAALEAFGRGIVMFAVAIGQGGPEIARAFGRILNNLLDQAIKAIPKIATVSIKMLNAMLRVVVNSAPKIADAGLKLILALLTALDNNLPKLIDRGASVAVKFIEGLGRNVGKMADAGAKFIIKVMEGVSEAIRNNSEEFGAAGIDIGLAIIEGIQSAIEGAAGRLADAAKDVAGDVVDGVKNFIGGGGPAKLLCEEVGKPMMEGWAGGIEKGAPSVMKSMDTASKGTMSLLGKAMLEIEDAMSLDPNFNPTITPVLDLTALTQEANKMSSILATAPIIPSVSYQTAADISAATQATPPDDGTSTGGGGGEGGDTYVFEQHLHSPEPIDSVAAFRRGRSLLAMKKHEVTTTKKEE